MFSFRRSARWRRRSVQHYFGSSGLRLAAGVLRWLWRLVCAFGVLHKPVHTLGVPTRAAALRLSSELEPAGVAAVAAVLACQTLLIVSASVGQADPWEEASQLLLAGSGVGLRISLGDVMP